MFSLEAIEFRTVRQEDDAEFLAYLRLFWDHPLGQNPYFKQRTDAFVERWARSARERETSDNTFSGIALHGEEIVGLHLLRLYDEYEGPAAHIAALWVHPDYRRIGIARRLKLKGEVWARIVGAKFLNTNVTPENDAMLRLNEDHGFRVFRLNMRKDL
jgi:GNAT superfamily N-acetyltransferase